MPTLYDNNLYDVWRVIKPANQELATTVTPEPRIRLQNHNNTDFIEIDESPLSNWMVAASGPLDLHLRVVLYNPKTNLQKHFVAWSIHDSDNNYKTKFSIECLNQNSKKIGFWAKKVSSS